MVLEERCVEISVSYKLLPKVSKGILLSCFLKVAKTLSKISTNLDPGNPAMQDYPSVERITLPHFVFKTRC